MTASTLVSNASTAVSVESLGKMYNLGQTRLRPSATLRDAIARRFSRPLSRDGSDNEEFWALRDVSFQVPRGEVVGIIGRNGAGKSTLLKLLSQITEPTEGRIHLRGRIASLLEVGTGFHPELTGRENIYLNGAMLGMSREEVRRKFDEIVAFAEVERFLETPVRRYSSGMYVRLAFAVAAHLEPEILVVDEVLAVGDAQFQKKCLGKLDEVAHDGRTVFFVSHNMAAIQRLCSRGILLASGRLVDDGPISQIVRRYNSLGQEITTKPFNPAQRTGSGWAQVTGMRMVDERGDMASHTTSDSDLILELDLAIADTAHKGTTLKGLVLELMFFNEQGQPLTSVMNVDDPGAPLPDSASCVVRMRLPGPTFVPGRYSINLMLGIPFLQHVDEIVNAFTFDVQAPTNPWRPYDLHEMRGNCCTVAEWTAKPAS